MTPNPHSDETIETIGIMWRGGASSGMIAKEVHLTRNQVIGIVNRRREKEGAEKWPPRMGARGGKPPKRQTRSKPHRRPYSAGRPKPVSTTTQRPSVNPEPPRESVKPIRFFLRELSQCAFIEGEPTSEALCCGAPVVEGTSWCPHHLARVTIERKKSTGHFRLMGLEAA